jgi:hypothetical protein
VQRPSSASPKAAHDANRRQAETEFFNEIDVKRSLPIAAVLISAAIVSEFASTLATATTSGYVSAGSKQARAARRVD